MTGVDAANAGEFLRWFSYLILLGIFLCQTYSFYATRRKIENFANVFPKKDGVYLAPTIDEKLEYEENDYSLYGNKTTEKSKEVSNFSEEKSEINTLINEYKDFCAKSNSMSKAKYKDGKTIIEEHLEKLEDTIHRSLATPLYLGLMGTIVGVVFGLWEYTKVMEAAELFKKSTGIALDTSNAIDYIIGSVKIAMIVTFLGLFFYVMNSTQKFSRAKDTIEKRKVRYYNNELRQKIPDDVEGGLAEIVYDMKRNLSNFNEQLGNNVSKMSENFDKSTAIIKDLPKLQEILNGISKNVIHFEKFDEKFKNVNRYLDKTGEFLEKICKYNSDVEMIESFKEIVENVNIIANRMNDGVEGNRVVLNTLDGHIGQLSKLAAVSENMQKNVRESLQNAEANISDSARGLSDRMADSFGNIEGSVESLKDSLEIKWQDTNAYMSESNRKIAENINLLEKHVESFNDNLKKSIDTQVSYISRSFVDSFTPILNHIGSLKASLNDNTLKKLANEYAVTEMESITATMTESFKAVYENMKQWQDKITENIKADIEKKTKENAQGELFDSIATLRMELQEIRENSKPRNIIKIIFGIR
jgi:hypothetical protein